MKGEKRRCKKCNNLFSKRRGKRLCTKKKNGFFETKKNLLITFSINENKNAKNSNNKSIEKKDKIVMNNIIENFIINNNIAFIIKFLILINIFSRAINNKLDFYFFQYSIISLKIKGVGESAILGNENPSYLKTINYLKEVYINGNKQYKKDYKYYFNQTDNFVELIWDDKIDDCSSMFSHCSSITEIDFSNFDTSLVTSMFCMFIIVYH